MANTVKISSCELINADCLEFIQTLPENSVDLIVTDPPYFKVKPEGWDNQWKGDDDYLKWLDQCLVSGAILACTEACRKSLPVLWSSPGI